MDSGHTEMVNYVSDSNIDVIRRETNMSVALGDQGMLSTVQPGFHIQPDRFCLMKGEICL